MIARRGWLAAEAAPKGCSTKPACAGLVEPNAPPSWVAFHVDNSQTLVQDRLPLARRALLRLCGKIRTGEMAPSNGASLQRMLHPEIRLQILALILLNVDGHQIQRSRNNVGT